LPNDGIKVPTLAERIASAMMTGVRTIAGSKPVAALEKMGQSINRGYAATVPLVTLGTAKPITPTTSYEKQVYGDTGGKPLTFQRSGAEFFGNENKPRSTMSLAERIGYPALGFAGVAADLTPGGKSVKSIKRLFHGTTVGAWKNMLKKGIRSGEVLMTSDFKKASSFAGKWADWGDKTPAILEFKPSVNKGLKEVSLKNGVVDRFMNPKLSVKDVARVLDDKGNVIYDATKPSKNAGKVRTGALTTAAGTTAGGVALEHALTKANSVEYKAPENKRKSSNKLFKSPLIKLKNDAESIKKYIAYNESRGEKHPYTFSRPSGSKELGKALGKYQVTEGELKSYAQRYIGKAVTPQEFLRSPKLQEQYMLAKIMRFMLLGYKPEEIADIHRSGFTTAGEPGEGKIRNKGYTKSFLNVKNFMEHVK